MDKTRLAVGTAFTLAALAVAIDHTRHRLPEPRPAALGQPAGTAAVDDESPCGLDSSPCGLEESPCGLDGGGTPCGLEGGGSPCGLDGEGAPCGLGGDASPCGLAQEEEPPCGLGGDSPCSL